MKTILAATVLFTATFAIPRPAHAQCPTISTPDVWLHNYTGDMKRGGVLAYGQGDYVIGTALTSNGIPFPGFNSGLPPCTFLTPWDRNVGDALTLENVTPACNGINYVMNSHSLSYRTDGQMDHIEQDGLAWGSNSGDGSTPASIAQIEAGSLYGTGSRAGQPGFGNVFIDLEGFCYGGNAI
jgi:hypothetical protein